MTQSACKILTIGDGDLSFSLALKRAYPNVSVTASTLIESSEALHVTYSNATENQEEFQSVWKEEVFYKVDATRLDTCPRLEGKKYDIVMFNHPHLGDSTLHISETHHAQRHHILLSHYFHAAKRVLRQNGRIHACLCGTQPLTWSILEAATRNGLKCVSQEGTSSPLHNWLFEAGQITNTAAKVKKHYPCKRKYRNGRLGSKHFLGRYGYCHRRTGGDLYGGNDSDMSVHQSVNFVFTCESEVKSIKKGESTKQCKICGIIVADEHAMKEHLEAPAVPDIMSGEFLYEKKTESKPSPSDNHDDKLTSAKIKPSAELSNASKFGQSQILIEATVLHAHDSKRLKWLCRQDSYNLSKYMKTKKQCTDIIKSGRIFVNGDLALDHGRIVKENDVITLINPWQEETGSIQSDKTDDFGVKIIKTVPIGHASTSTGTNLVVLHKPVGIRVAGSFAANTLQMITQSLLGNIVCTPISKLETGCSGLCVVTTSQSQLSVELGIKVIYKFTVLVHGTVPLSWKGGIRVKVPDSGPRNWKRVQTDESKKSSSGVNSKLGNYENPSPPSHINGSNENSLLIVCTDILRLRKSSLAFSTLEIQSAHGLGRLSNVISFVLRKMDFPVVNDRFCKRELSALPRIMRNMLKRKICICCNGLDIKLTSEQVSSDEIISTAPNKLTQCSHWRDILNEP